MNGGGSTVAVAVVARDTHGCWLRLTDGVKTVEGEEEAVHVLTAPVHVARARDVGEAIEEAIVHVLGVPSSGVETLDVRCLGRCGTADGGAVEVVAVVADELLEPDPALGLARVAFDEAAADLDDVRDAATVAGLRTFGLASLPRPAPVWGTRRATIRELEGRVGGEPAYLGRFDATQWEGREDRLADVSLGEALRWAREQAAEVTLTIGGRRYDAGTRRGDDEHPSWDGAAPLRPAPVGPGRRPAGGDAFALPSGVVGRTVDRSGRGPVPVERWRDPLQDFSVVERSCELATATCEVLGVVRRDAGAPLFVAHARLAAADGTFETVATGASVSHAEARRLAAGDALAALRQDGSETACRIERVIEDAAARRRARGTATRRPRNGSAPADETRGGAAP